MLNSTFFSLALICLTGFTGYSQTATPIGIYYFSDNGTSCPHNPSTTVDVQPVNATFSAYSTVGTICSQTLYQFSNTGWNTASTVDLNEYNEFTLTANSNYVFDLDSISFGHRTNSSTLCNWHLRSNLDNYAADISSGQTNTFFEYPDIPITGFTNLSQVTFRFYVTDISSASDTWRQDDVKIYGTIYASMGAGINENQMTSGIYPNPGNEELTIRTNNSIDVVEVYNITGQLIVDHKVTAQNYTTLDTRKLIPGYYRILLKMGDHVEQHSWIKK